jgi:hypothetical protein
MAKNCQKPNTSFIYNALLGGFTKLATRKQYQTSSKSAEKIYDVTDNWPESNPSCLKEDENEIHAACERIHFVSFVPGKRYKKMWLCFDRATLLSLRATPQSSPWKDVIRFVTCVPILCVRSVACDKFTVHWQPSNARADNVHIQTRD